MLKHERLNGNREFPSFRRHRFAVRRRQRQWLPQHLGVGKYSLNCSELVRLPLLLWSLLTAWSTIELWSARKPATWVYHRRSSEVSFVPFDKRQKPCASCLFSEANLSLNSYYRLLVQNMSHEPLLGSETVLEGCETEQLKSDGYEFDKAITRRCLVIEFCLGVSMIWKYSFEWVDRVRFDSHLRSFY